MHIHQVLFGSCLYIHEIYTSTYSARDHPNSLNPSPPPRPQIPEIHLAELTWLNPRFSRDDEIRGWDAANGVDFVGLEMEI
jgi:hypothetical protein